MPKFRYKPFKQGLYRPQNLKKCMNTSKSCVYRSSYELKFMRFCDNNPNVIKWGAEPIAIPYLNPLDNKVHRYFPDNIIFIKEGEEIVKYLIEIKPSRETAPPNNKNRKNKQKLLFEQKTFVKNMAKWDAAKQWSKKNGYKFMILTEKELNI